MSVVLLTGSPSSPSRSAAVLFLIEDYLRRQGIATIRYGVNDFAPEALLLGQFDSTSVKQFQRDVAEADGLVVATPVYKASFSGVLKTMLDLLPQEALQNKVVLPIASAGSIAHLLVLDYALKPVLSAMKAQEIIAGVFVQDKQVEYRDADARFDEGLRERLEAAAAQFTQAIHCRLLIKHIELPEYVI
ncbi:NADPH-dependent FMN reductase [Stenoxybacter acetivorans]|uniref:NADPH-dependent FMN reductase n=1 Tax=Stenoxybacter acetivorans TaxID=422441 RepID=UPI0005687DA3|nr:NADPH-dependent FMN reductase [Stenoxybacter acetivorans]